MDLNDEVYIYVVDKEESITSYQLNEIYKIKEEDAPIIRRIGSWSSGGNSSPLFLKEDKNKRRSDLAVSVHNFLLTSKYVNGSLI